MVTRLMDSPAGATAESISFRTAGGAARPGLSLCGTRFGSADPAALPAVFLPGLGFTVECYAPMLVPALARLEAEGQPLRLYALNLPGHGGADAPAARQPDFMPSLDAPVDAAAEFIAALPGPVLLLAHSFGGTMSVLLAARYPQHVRGLLLLEPGVRGRRNQPWDDAYRLDNSARVEQRRDRWPSLAEAAAALRPRGIYQSWTDQAFDGFLRTGFVADGGGHDASEGVRLACPPWLEAQGYAVLPGPEMFDWALAIRAPAVFLRAADSPVAPPGALEELAALLTTGSVITVPGTHCFPMEHPQAAAEAVVTALRMLLRHDGEGTARL